MEPYQPYGHSVLETSDAQIAAENIIYQLENRSSATPTSATATGLSMYTHRHNRNRAPETITCPPSSPRPQHSQAWVSSTTVTSSITSHVPEVLNLSTNGTYAAGRSDSRAGPSSAPLVPSGPAPATSAGNTPAPGRFHDFSIDFLLG